MSGTKDEPEPRSRTALSKERKGDEQRLAALAKTLVGLSNRQRDKIALEDDILEAVLEARRIKAHSARARQLRIVRRALRDADNRAIADAVDAMLNPHRRPTRLAREAQRWVERFLTEGDAALETLLAEHEQVDRQHLRGLLRNARKPDAKKAAKAKKSLIGAVEALLAAGEERERSET